MAEHGTTTYAVLETIYYHWKTSRVGPTLEEIRADVNLSSPSAVHLHIKKLEEEGLVSRVPKKHRSMRPTHKGVRLVDLMREFDHYEEE